METALKIRQQAEEQREAMKELMEWQESLAAGNKKTTSKKSSPPVFHQKLDKNPESKIKSFEYDKWDRFNVDEALEQVDYEPSQVISTSSAQIKQEISNTKMLEDALFEKEKGNAYFKKAKYRKAIQCYSKSIEYDSTSAIPFVNRSLAYIKLEKYKDAVEDASQALLLDPKNVKALWRRGLAKKELKEFGQAQNDFELALVLEPTNKVIQNDKKQLELLMDTLLRKDVDSQPLIVPQKPIRRRIPITDINRNTALPSAAEKMLPKTALASIRSIDKPAEVATVLPSSSMPITLATDKELDLVRLENVGGGGSKEELVNVTESSALLDNGEELSQEVGTVVGDGSFACASPVDGPILSPTAVRVIETLYEFEREWKTLKTDPDRQFEFLRLFDSLQLLKIFKSSFEVSYLKDIIQLIRSFYVEKKMFLEIERLLFCISKFPRFKMVILLLSKQEKTDLKWIVGLLRENGSDSAGELTILYKIK